MAGEIPLKPYQKHAIFRGYFDEVLRARGFAYSSKTKMYARICPGQFGVFVWLRLRQGWIDVCVRAVPFFMQTEFDLDARVDPVQPLSLKEWLNYLALRVPALAKRQLDIPFRWLGYTQTEVEQSIGGQFRFFEAYLLPRLDGIRTLDDLLSFYDDTIGDAFGPWSFYPFSEKIYIHLYRRDYEKALAELNALRDRYAWMIREEQNKFKGVESRNMPILKGCVSGLDRTIDEVRRGQCGLILDSIDASILRWDAELKAIYPAFYRG